VKAIEHIAALIVHAARSEQDGLGIFIDEMPGLLLRRYALVVSEETLNKAVDLITAAGGGSRITDDIAGDLLRIIPDDLLAYFGPSARRPGSQTPVEFDRRYNRAHTALPILESYSFGQDQWVTRVVERLSSGAYDGISSAGQETKGWGIPASDRVVEITDNQERSINEAVKEVEDLLSKENSVGGDAGLRQRFLGQLSAGRELIRSQSVRAYLVYETLARMLLTLIEKYKGLALGEAAKKLLHLLIENIFR
jgi:hypothetical protein